MTNAVDKDRVIKVPYSDRVEVALFANGGCQVVSRWSGERTTSEQPKTLIGGDADGVMHFTSRIAGTSYWNEERR